MSTQSNLYRSVDIGSAAASILDEAFARTQSLVKHGTNPKIKNPQAFLDVAIATLDCSLTFSGGDLRQMVPQHGPAIVVANQPFFGIESILLTRALLALRPDTKTMTNSAFADLPELSSLFFCHYGDQSSGESGAELAARHLSNNGLMLIFPAQNFRSSFWHGKQIIDSSWDNTIGQLARQYQASCVPIFIHGGHPKYFQLARLLTHRLRTTAPSQLRVNIDDNDIHMTLGQPILPKDTKRLGSATEISHTLRLATFLMAPTEHQQKQPPIAALANTDEHQQNKIPANMLAELAEFKLLSKSDFDVYCVPFARLNELADVLAMERETTFRAAGEGTGKTKDRDCFDPIYQHLFIWDRKQQAIVGGARLGNVEEIVAEHGIDALYSRSLYNYNEKYLASLGSALEIGRFFITQNYQRHPAALDLVWRGIGQFVLKQPGYQVLVGCLSISSELSQNARAFIADAMMANFAAEPKFLHSVKPKIPLKINHKTWSTKLLSTIKDLSIVNKLVSYCDRGKIIPVLLRHCLNLNGRLVCFTVNRGFNDSLDGLILVGLKNIPERYLVRYLGEEGRIKMLAAIDAATADNNS